MNGLELSSLLKAERSDIPIVMCTGFSEGVPSDTIKAHGISDIVMKPMIASELSRIIKEALTQKEKQVRYDQDLGY